MLQTILLAERGEYEIMYQLRHLTLDFAEHFELRPYELKYLLVSSGFLLYVGFRHSRCTVDL